MVKKQTVENWSLPCIGFELADDGETVLKIYCLTCRSYYSDRKPSSTSYVRGFVANLSDKWVDGTEVIKKCNAVDHISKSSAHRQALQLQGQRSPNPTTSVNSRQTTISDQLRKITHQQRGQLVKKFQLIHWLMNRCKSFNEYEQLVTFEKNVHKVDLGLGYLDSRAARVMAHFLAISIKQHEITDPLNSGDRKYFSLFYDGSSSAKTLDEKEVYVIKTCKEGEASYQVLSLEEPENTNAPGLKAALERSIAKANFNFNRKTRQIGNGSDGASVNKALFQLEKQDLGNHLVQGWCANHKAELGIKDSFKNSELNKEAETVVDGIYYFFRKATLKWRLFKHQSTFLEMKYLKYKRPSGTRWVAHQVDATFNFVRNLPILLSFLHQQIHTPHNKTMVDAKAIMEGHLRNVGKLTLVLYLCVKHDILAYIVPFSKILESKQLLAPTAFTAMKNAGDTMARIHDLLSEKGHACFYMEDLFPMVAKYILPYLKDDDSPLPGRTTRGQGDETAAIGSKRQTFHDYPLSITLDRALNKVHSEVKEIVGNLHRNLVARFGEFLDSDLFRAASIILDSKSYRFKTVDEILKSVEIVSLHFSVILEENGCDSTRFRQELTCIHNHVTSFLLKTPNETVWQQLFSSQAELGITNIIHIVEICIVLPISSADVERVFSTFTRLISKDRQSLKTSTLEDLLVIRSNDFDGYQPQRYDSVVDKFLQFNPNGSVRKRSVQLTGRKEIKRKPGTASKQNKRHCNFLSTELLGGTEEIELVSSDEESDEEYAVSSTSSEWSESEP